MTIFSNWNEVVSTFALAGTMPESTDFAAKIERGRQERATGIMHRGHRRIATWPILAAWVAKRGPEEAARRQNDLATPAGPDGAEIRDDVVLSILKVAAVLIVDWHAAMLNDPTHKLMRMNFAEAKASAERWHAGKAKREAKEHRRLARGPAVGEGTRLEAFDGRYWVLLTTREALRQESIRLHHCVGWDTSTYASLYVDEPVDLPEGIWSLREADGKRSLLTAEVDEHGEILQCRGLCNMEPSQALEDDMRVLEMTLAYAAFRAKYEDEFPEPGVLEEDASEARRVVRDLGL